MIETPRHETGHPDRAQECREAIRPLIEDMIERASERGWASNETIAAIAKVLGDLRLADETIPAPQSGRADPEPANDWPSA